MKFNIEVEIDWLEEGGCIDDEIKNQIIDGITRKIDKKAQEKVIEEVERKVQESVNEKVDALIDSILTDFVGKEITLTDKWGDKVKEIKIMDLLKEKFDKFMTEKVNEKGVVPTSSYDEKYSRVDYILNNRIKAYGDKRTKELAEDVEKKIKEVFSEGVEMSVKNKIIKHLGLENMMNNAKQLA